ALDPVLGHEVEGARRTADDGLPNLNRATDQTRHQRDLFELIAALGHLGRKRVVLAAVREGVFVERLHDDLELLLEQLAVRRIVQHGGAECLDLASVVATADAEDHPSVGEDVGHREILGQSYPSLSMCWAMSFEISKTLARCSLEYPRSARGVPAKPMASPSRTCPAYSAEKYLIILASPVTQRVRRRSLGLRSLAARKLEEPLWQPGEITPYLFDRDYVGVLRLHVAQVDGVTGLGAIETRFLRDGDTEVVTEGVKNGGADAAARRRPRHDDAVASEQNEVGEQVCSEESARLLLQDDDVVRLRCELVDDLIAVAPGLCDAALVGTRVLPRPAPGVPVIHSAHPRRVDDGHSLGVGPVDELPDPRHPIGGLGGGGITPALDRFQDRLTSVAAEVVVDVDHEQRRTVAKPSARAVAGCCEHRLVALGQELVPDRLGHGDPPS